MNGGRDRPPQPPDEHLPPEVPGEPEEEDLDFSVVDLPILTEVLEPQAPGKPDPDRKPPL